MAIDQNMNKVGYPSSAEEQILNTIQTLIDANNSKSMFDQTIVAEIVSCEDEYTGKYKIKYQDIMKDAYAVSPDVHFENGSTVYVLMPQNQFNDRRIILYGEKTSASYSRALPVCMITVNSNTDYVITTRKGTETYSARTEKVKLGLEEESHGKAST